MKRSILKYLKWGLRKKVQNLTDILFEYGEYLENKWEFEEKISTMWKLLVLAEMCFDASSCISSNISNKNNAVSKIDFFHLARFLFWRTGIIEFSKLLSSKKSDKYNVRKLLCSSSRDQFWGKLNIDPETIQKWSESLTRNEGVIKNILRLETNCMLTRR